MDEKTLVLENIHLKKRGKPVLEKVNMELKRGEIGGLIGPNGAGKTTLLKVIMNLLTPDKGRINILGKEMGEMTPRDWKKVSFASEEINYYPQMTVEGILEFNGRLFGNWDREKAQKMLKELELPRKIKMRELSRGMKSKLDFIVALAGGGDLLILDEPLSGLDYNYRLQVVRKLVGELVSREGRTVLFSSHFLGEVDRIAERVFFMDRGKLQEFGRGGKIIRVVFQEKPPAKFFALEEIEEIKEQGELGYLLSVQEENVSRVWEECGKYPHYVLEIYYRGIEDLFKVNTREDKND